jgi:hypothetical protein
LIINTDRSEKLGVRVVTRTVQRLLDSAADYRSVNDQKPDTGDGMKTLLLVLLLAATVAQAETYKWTDTEGTVHFMDSRDQVPAEQLNSTKPPGTDANKSTTRSIAVSPAEYRQSVDGYGAVAPQMEELKERMMKDDGTVALIGALQNDPDMLALLSDPSIVHAIQAGDIGTLMNNPVFMKLLNNPRLREIENRVQQGGTR